MVPLTACAADVRGTPRLHAIPIASATIDLHRPMLKGI